MSSKWLISTFSVSVYCLPSMQLCVGCTQTLGCDQWFYQMYFNIQDFGDLFSPLPPSTSEPVFLFLMGLTNFYTFKCSSSESHHETPHKCPFPSAPWPSPLRGWFYREQGEGQHAVPHQAQKLLLEDCLKDAKEPLSLPLFSLHDPCSHSYPNFAAGRKGQIPGRESWRESGRALLRSQNLLRISWYSQSSF